MGLVAFGYVFDNETPNQVIPIGADVLFSNNNGPLFNIGHTPGTSQIIIFLAGNYNINFAIYTSGNNPQEWGITVDGVIEQEFSASGQVMSLGATLTLSAGSIVTIRNLGTLPNPASLRAGYNSAWVQINKID